MNKNIVNYHFPLFQRLLINFLRKVISGDKNVRSMIFCLGIEERVHYKDCNSKVQRILSSIDWLLIKEISELLKFFHDYSKDQLVDRKYMFQVFITITFKIVSNIVMN